MVVRGRRTKLSLVVAAGLLTLSGCAGLTPGSAVVVGDTQIGHDRVDDVAQALCSATLSQAQLGTEGIPTLPTRGSREAALQILLETELSQQFGEAQGIASSPGDASQAVAQNENAILMLPEEDRDVFRSALREYAEGQLILIEAGRQSLNDPFAAEDQALAEGQRLRNAFVSGLDVEIDPRYGRFEDGTFKRGGTSLSVPASDRARQGERANPPEAWVAELPASQQCR